jgi:hypothetical protein
VWLFPEYTREGVSTLSLTYFKCGPMAKSFLNMPGYPLGLRNNNPGNLRATSDQWQGMIGTNQGFVQFKDISYGIRALAIDLAGDIREGKNTIEALITEFAPPSENDTRAYINAVATYTGIGWDQTLNPNSDTLVKLIRAITNVELGSTFAPKITITDIQQGVSMMDSQIPVGEIGLGVSGGLLLLAVGLLLTMPKKSK